MKLAGELRLIAMLFKELFADVLNQDILSLIKSEQPLPDLKKIARPLWFEKQYCWDLLFLGSQMQQSVVMVNLKRLQESANLLDSINQSEAFYEESFQEILSKAKKAIIILGYSLLSSLCLENQWFYAFLNAKNPELPYPHLNYQRIGVRLPALCRVQPL